jgi:hypothetical protein
MLLMSDDLMSTSLPFAVAKGKRRFRRPVNSVMATDIKVDKGRK